MVIDRKSNHHRWMHRPHRLPANARCMQAWLAVHACAIKDPSSSSYGNANWVTLMRAKEQAQRSEEVRRFRYLARFSDEGCWRSAIAEARV